MQATERPLQTLLRNTVALVLGLRGGVARRGTAAAIGGKPRSIIVETGPLRDGSNLRVIVGGGAAGDVPWCNISEKIHRLGMAILGAATLLRSQHQKFIRQILSCIGHRSTAWLKRVRAPLFAFPM